jgi:hypothetical protein
MTHPRDSVQLKMDVMFEGIRYTPALGEAARHSYPNFYQYRFQPDEPNPTGAAKADIPYLMVTPDDTHLRIQGNRHSQWSIEGDKAAGYRLVKNGTAIDVSFEPRPQWMDRVTSDGFPMARAGIGLHADMAVVNVAPGCEFFLHKEDGAPMRCSFCSYGAPDERTAHLGQVAGRVAVPEVTLRRMQETLRAAVDDREIRHIYLVGGSLVDARQEAERFLQVARAVQSVNDARLPVALGSGALPPDALEAFRRDDLVQNVCFNLEVWSEPLFAKVCAGKNRYVGYERWIESLQAAVGLWGPGHVYSAMVAGIELEPEHEFEWQAAADLAIEGAEALCSRGIIPIYSLYWPTGGKNHPEYLHRLRSYFERLNTAYQRIRRAHKLAFSDTFVCHRCSYMQIECDLDRTERLTS